MPVKRPFAELVRERLKALDMTQQQLAERLEMDATVLSRILNERLGPPLDDAQKWADALGLSGDERRTLVVSMGLVTTPDVVKEYLLEMHGLLEECRHFRERCERKLSHARKLFEQVQWDKLGDDD